jgi:hypothetical protein
MSAPDTRHARMASLSPLARAERKERLMRRHRIAMVVPFECLPLC